MQKIEMVDGEHRKGQGGGSCLGLMHDLLISHVLGLGEFKDTINIRLCFVKKQTFPFL